MLLVYAVHLQSYPFKFLLLKDFGYRAGTSLPNMNPYFNIDEKDEPQFVFVLQTVMI